MSAVSAPSEGGSAASFEHASSSSVVSAPSEVIESGSAVSSLRREREAERAQSGLGAGLGRVSLKGLGLGLGPHLAAREVERAQLAQLVELLGQADEPAAPLE